MKSRHAVALAACCTVLIACEPADAEGPPQTTSHADSPQAAAPHEAPEPPAVAPAAEIPVAKPSAFETPVAASPVATPAAEAPVIEPPVIEAEAAPDAAPFLAAQALAGYDKLLRDHVDADGFVDYDAIAADPSFLKAYVATLADPGILSSDEPAEKLATLINAYNAFTLALILDHYDGGKLKSITDLHDGKPWDQKTWNLAGQTVSLNQIEHEMIRPVFAEPRIHWALVCAAYSCPPLRAEAYTGKQLEDQLASQENYVLNFAHPRYATRVGLTVNLTPLFEWYGGDFGDWKTYAAKRLGLAPQEAIDGFVEYDWRLNSAANKQD